MKIGFENKTLSCYKEIYHQTKYIQETCENVVPDTNDDIGKIASVQSCVHLKSKDLTGRGVLISGEAVAAVIYVTENERNVSFVKLSKQFSVEYEISEIEADILPQIKLDVQNTEARIINPRKISVTFEICGDLSCYKSADVSIQTVIDKSVDSKIHAKYETVPMTGVNAVCEKTFTLSEQLIFPGGKPVPAQIAMVKSSFDLNESQNVGSKLIIKGNMNLCVCYLSDEVNYPVKAEFSTPFSQIIDVGVDEVDSYSTIVEISAVYYDIINTISGEKALDIEIHAVLQICSRENREIKYISDVYSNLMPAVCTTENQKLTNSCQVQQIKLIADERISVVEDCSDVLSVFTGISQLNIQPEKISASVNLDIVYRTRNGNLSAVRRIISVSGECSRQPERMISAVLADVYLRPDGAYIDAHAAIDVKYLTTNQIEISRVAGVELDEENIFDFSSFPAVCLVRAEEETLWSIAKKYHSSVEKICASNQTEDGIKGKLLLIPRSI